MRSSIAGSRPSVALVAAAAALVLAGCGADGSCDDAAFRAQDEQLYVAIAAARNAKAGGGSAASLAADLDRAADVLERAVAATQPCAEVLRNVAESEREAILELREAAAALTAGRRPGAGLAEAAAALERAERTLFGGAS